MKLRASLLAIGVLATVVSDTEEVAAGGRRRIVVRQPAYVYVATAGGPSATGAGLFGPGQFWPFLTQLGLNILQQQIPGLNLNQIIPQLPTSQPQPLTTMTQADERTTTFGPMRDRLDRTYKNLGIPITGPVTPPSPNGPLPPEPTPPGPSDVPDVFP